MSKYFDINPSKKVLHIQFGGQYLPQYITFCYMSYLITEAWLSSFPMIPIALVYNFSGMNDSFTNGGIGGQYIPQYNISADIGQYYSVYCSIFCAQFTPIVSQYLKKNVSLTLITMIIITMIHATFVTCG